MISVAVEIDEAATQVTADIVDLVEIAVATILTREDADTNDGTLSVTVLLTSDERLRQLNRDYAGDDYVTDVLSFSNDQPGRISQRGDRRFNPEPRRHRDLPFPRLNAKLAKNTNLSSVS